MLQESHENLLRKTVFSYTYLTCCRPASRQKNPIWTTNMFAVIIQEQFKNNWGSNCAKTYEQRGQNLLVLIKKKFVLVGIMYIDSIKIPR